MHVWFNSERSLKFLCSLLQRVDLHLLPFFVSPWSKSAEPQLIGLQPCWDCVKIKTSYTSPAAEIADAECCGSVEVRRARICASSSNERRRALWSNT
jgi:hypothetical protein